MIIKSNCCSYELYLRHIIAEIFPHNYFYTDETVYLTVSKDHDIVTAIVEIRSLKEIFFNSIRLFSSERTATTCAIGQATIKIAKILGYPSPHYGVLTGVRPIKIASDILKSHSFEEYKKIFEDVYCVDSEKSRLLYNCAKYDKIVRAKHLPSDVSIYISIPFCPTRCNYCSFVSSSVEKKQHLIPLYLNVLDEELQAIQKIISDNSLTLKSIYVGGGTPGVLNANQTDFLLRKIDEYFETENLCEFSYEIGRPDTVTEEKLLILKKHNVGRISINTQTTNDAVLKKIGRNHTSDDYFNSIKFAQSLSFDCINSDLIAGLTDEDFESFKNSLRDVTSLGIDNVSVHTLAVKKSSYIKENSTSLTSSEKVDNFITFSVNHCISKGFKPYYLYRQKNSIGNNESTGYCKSDKFSHYNIAMMNEIETVIGIGAGATSRIVSKQETEKHIHFENYKYPDDYIKDRNKMLINAQKINNALTRE